MIQTLIVESASTAFKISCSAIGLRFTWFPPVCLTLANFRKFILPTQKVRYCKNIFLYILFGLKTVHRKVICLLRREIQQVHT